MRIGFGTLQWSADIAFPEEKEKTNKFLEVIMTIFSVLIALSLICGILSLLSLYFYHKINTKWENESFD